MALRITLRAALLATGLASASILGFACSSSGDGDSSESAATACNAPVTGIRLKQAFPNLKFAIPTTLILSPDKSTYFVTEKAGVIKSFANDEATETANVVLDIRDRVNSGDREPGINGLALHPSWPKVPEAYVTYNGFVNGNNYSWKLVRFVSRDGGRTLDRNSEVVLIEANKPASEHNGGNILFHPTEKGVTGVPLMYVSVGDSEQAKGPLGNAQNTNSIFGKFLRIDILDAATRAAKKIEYDAPEDNPFQAKGEFPPVNGNPRGRKEIYSWGHRNPWRWSFDQHDGKVDIWEGEVGQDAFEEVNVVKKAHNYGWNFKESLHTQPFCRDVGNCVQKPLGVCKPDQGDKCAKDAPAGISDPEIEIPHRADPNDALTRNAGGYVAQSVTGGFVYRGTNEKLASLRGLYIYADFQNGSFYAAVPNEKMPKELRSKGGDLTPLKIGSGAMVTTFTLDENGEILAADFRGSIFRVVSGSCPQLPDPNARTYTYLSKQGILTYQEGLEYLISAFSDIPAVHDFKIDPAKMPRDPKDFGKFQGPNYTIGEYKKEFMSGERVSAVYKNDLDLGFWRQIECSKEFVSRGEGKAPSGACCVTNWPSTDDKNFDPTRGNPVSRPIAELTEDKDNLGAVCMNISPEGFTRFAIFGAQAPHRIQPFAILDGEGAKVSPALCTPCHGGTYAGSGDLGSIFRELEPSALKRHPDVTQDQAEEQWFQLNQTMKSANRLLKGNATTPLANGVTSQEAILKYIDSLYPTGAPPAISSHDLRHVPPSFLENAPGVTAEYKQAKVDLYTKLIGPYCSSCHRYNNTDLDKYDFVRNMAVPSGDDVLLHQLIFPINGDPQRLTLPQMPQAAYQQFKLVNDKEAINSINAWVGQLADPKLPQCEVTFIVGTDVNRPNFDTNNEGVRILGQTQPPQGVASLGRPDPLSNWKAADPGLDLHFDQDLTNQNGGHFTYTGHASFPQGSNIEFKAVVGKNESVRFERFGQGNRTFTVPRQTTAVVRFEWEN
jgi:glucose/arabinose dehydrogenase